jgi:hypothetical protein
MKSGFGIGEGAEVWILGWVGVVFMGWNWVVEFRVVCQRKTEAGREGHLFLFKSIEGFFHGLIVCMLSRCYSIFPHLFFLFLGAGPP